MSSRKPFLVAHGCPVFSGLSLSLSIEQPSVGHRAHLTMIPYLLKRKYPWGTHLMTQGSQMARQQARPHCGMQVRRGPPA